MIEEARARGGDVTLDNDTHTELAPRLSRALPQPLHSLPVDALVACCPTPSGAPSCAARSPPTTGRDPATRAFLQARPFRPYRRPCTPPHRSLLGVSVADIAARRGRDPLDTYLDLIVEERDGIVAIFDYIDEAEGRAVLRASSLLISSDGLVQPFAAGPGDDASYWPCSFGEYTGLLERFVRDRPCPAAEEAVRKMTSLPAQRFGLWDRGVLRPGAAGPTSSSSTSNESGPGDQPLAAFRTPSRTSRRATPRGIDYVVRER